jgi:hypothetical protein
MAGLMGLVAGWAAGLAIVIDSVERGRSSEILFLTFLLDFGSPCLARAFAASRVAFWDWFAITGFSYMALSLGLLGISSSYLPTTRWLEAQARSWYPPRRVEEDWGRDLAEEQRLAFILAGQALVSLALAVWGAISASILTARRETRRAQERRRSDRIIADDARDEPIGPFRL